MKSLGSFPGVIEGVKPGAHIYGELYEVTCPQTMKNLDRLEGNGSFYTRYETEIVLPKTGQEFCAWMYQLPFEDRGMFPEHAGPVTTFLYHGKTVMGWIPERRMRSFPWLRRMTVFTENLDKNRFFLDDQEYM